MPAEPPGTVDAEAAELGRAHVARWLDEVLPSGSCLVWAGGVTLASVLATDGRRAVLLVEPAVGDLEEATRRPRVGVTLGGADALDPGDRYASGVIVAGRGPLAPLLDRVLDGPLRDAVVAVVVDPAGRDEVVAALEAAGRPSVTVPQHLRLASTLGSHDAPLPAATLGGPQDEPMTLIVLTGAVPAPSVLVGSDAGPTRSWADVEWVQRCIRDVDAELRAVDAVRIDELEAEATAAARREHDLEVNVDGLQRRIDDLEASTSWRLTAGLRWASDRARRR
jgi:hypothetical protein